MPIHEKVSSYPDDGDASTISAPDWNATHVDKVTRTSSALTLDTTHDVVAVGSGASISLPAASAREGQRYQILNADGYAGGVTIGANGADTIFGQSSYTLPNKGDYVHLSADGVSEWLITAAGSVV